MNLLRTLPGRDEEETLVGLATGNVPGTELKISCKEGYDLNGDIPGKKVVCGKRGEWSPSHPRCDPLRCRLPDGVKGGKFVMGEVILPNLGQIEHGKEVELSCEDGYHRAGPEKRRCWYGEWSSGTGEEPKCVGNPCRLAEIGGGGRYIGNGGNYRPGQLIPDGSRIDFECPGGERDKNVRGEALLCQRGSLTPQEARCEEGRPPAAAKEDVRIQEVISRMGPSRPSSSLPFSASTHLVEDGDISFVENIVDGDEDAASGIGTTSARLVQPRTPCPQPSNVGGSLVYLSDSRQPLAIPEAGEFQFPHGSEVRFDCIPKEEEDEEEEGSELRSWKIVCSDGEWKGKSLSCDSNGNPLPPESEGVFNGSCVYTPPRSTVSNTVAFVGDRELYEGEKEAFGPGTELVYRCTDVGGYMHKGICIWDI